MCVTGSVNKSRFDKRNIMSLVAYLIYVFGAFSFYMLWVLGLAMFVEVIVPWLIFVAVIFAPLIWFVNRSEK